MNEAFEDWLKTRPAHVQEIVRKYPPGIYRIKEGAPYAISCPGTTCYLHSYTELPQEGKVEIKIVVLPGDLMGSAINHIIDLCLKYNHTNINERLNSPHKVLVDPKFLELIEAD